MFENNLKTFQMCPFKNANVLKYIWNTNIFCSGVSGCTGSFRESGRPAPGTKCALPCVMDSGRWGASYCYTKEDKSQWGAECVACGGKYINFL